MKYQHKNISNFLKFYLIEPNYVKGGNHDDGILLGAKMGNRDDKDKAQQ